VSPREDVILSTAQGMSIRFSEGDARAMGRNTMGVKGISLSSGDRVVGMVVADENATLLTACEHGYGKRTPFGTGDIAEDELDQSPEGTERADESAVGDAEASTDSPQSGNARYRRQRRGGKGL